jgi:hypothetical protein
MMLMKKKSRSEIKQNVGLKLFDSIKNGYAAFFLLFFIGFACDWHYLYGMNSVEPKTISYYLYIADFERSFIEISTSNVFDPSTTIISRYLAGRAPLYNINDEQAGICSASFLCMQTTDGIFTDIANYISTDDGLIVTWFTPTTLINLELDTIINSMVTECMVTATTKVGVAPFYGQTFDLIVSSDGEKIHFKFTRIVTIF